VEPRLSPIDVVGKLVATAHGGDVAKGDRGGSYLCVHRVRGTGGSSLTHRLR
jgi:hypothetical protein